MNEKIIDCSVKVSKVGIYLFSDLANFLNSFESSLYLKSTSNYSDLDIETIENFLRVMYENYYDKWLKIEIWENSNRSKQEIYFTIDSFEMWLNLTISQSSIIDVDACVYEPEYEED